MLCLVSDELLKFSVPATLLQSPIEADAVEPIDAILRKQISQVGYPLMAYPLSKLALPVRYIAVAVLCLVFDELIESSLPSHDCPALFHVPLEANAAESVDAILCKRFGHVGSSLMAYPLSKLASLHWDVTVAVLRSIIEQLLESRVPFFLDVFVLHLTVFSLLLQVRCRDCSTAPTLL